MLDPSQVVTYAELEEDGMISRQTLTRWVKEGRLQGRKIGKTMYFSLGLVDHCIETREEWNKKK